MHVSTRENAIINRLNKTKVEKEVDHEAERQARLKVEGRKKKAAAEERVSRRRVVQPYLWTILERCSLGAILAASRAACVC